MQTVLSKTGIEVCYPCSVHLLQNGENLECEYKSDHTGQDLLEYVCRVQNIYDFSFWGLKFMNADCMDEQRHWLDMDKLIRTQVKNIMSPIRFYFRLKVYPPEPYKIVDQNIRYPIYQQLRLDLLGGRLFCNITEAAMLVALILQHVHGNYDQSFLWVYLAYMKNKILRKERCTGLFFYAAQKRALEIYQKLLLDLTQLEVEDMFLRLASKLDSYGVEPFLVKDINKKDVILWINYSGFRVINRKRKILHVTWNNILKITHEGKGLFVHLRKGGLKVFECINFSECSYIWSLAVQHLLYFTSIKSIVNSGVRIDARFYSDDEKNSQMSSYFCSNFSEITSQSFEEACLKKELCVAKSFFQLIDFNSWKSQLSVIYAVVMLYFMGIHTTLLDDLPYLESVKTCLQNFLSRFVFNKMMSF